MTTIAREDVNLHGRRFTFRIEGPDPARRYSVAIIDAATGRGLTRAPVRARSAQDARDRALEVVANLVGIERFHEQVIAAAAEFAPGAVVELTENAQAIRADLSGPWMLTVSLSVPRDVVTDPDGSLDDLRARIREHFRNHLRRAGA